MNKKTGEFSAADLKRPVGKKEPPQAQGGGSSYGPGGKVPGRFVCGKCQKEHPDSEVAKDKGPGLQKTCKACDVRLVSIADGTFRYGRNTFDSVRRASLKAHAKRYKSGRLPGWMFK